jgi:hypothetical protein
MTDYEQQLDLKLEKAKRTREQRAKLAVEEIKAVLFPLLADRLERALANGDNKITVSRYDTDNLSIMAIKQLLKLAIMEQPEHASGSKYIPSVFRPYLNTFKVHKHRDRITGTLYFSFEFIIKD